MIIMVLLCCLADYIFMIFKKKHVIIVYSNGISNSVSVSNFVKSVNILFYFTKEIEIC